MYSDVDKRQPELRKPILLSMMLSLELLMLEAKKTNEKSGSMYLRVLQRLFSVLILPAMTKPLERMVQQIE